MDKQAYNKAYYARTVNAANRRQVWTPEDLQIILDREMCDYSLSLLLDRSMKAIQCKRSEIINHGRESSNKAKRDQ